jgi:sec-independent protein translocase protein TatB
MLNIGFSELVLIAVVALVFIGPKQLPAVLRQVMKFVRELQSLGDDVKKQMHEVMKESGLEGTTTIIDMEGRKQQAYDIRDLEKLSAPKPKAGTDE